MIGTLANIGLTGASCACRTVASRKPRQTFAHTLHADALVLHALLAFDFIRTETTFVAGLAETFLEKTGALTTASVGITEIDHLLTFISTIAIKADANIIVTDAMVRAVVGASWIRLGLGAILTLPTRLTEATVLITVSVLHAITRAHSLDGAMLSSIS